ncbi:hypothetical protein G6F46_015750 [Rhizopus delemar]|nr:hypothetical protein G6F32_017001 [Rhizopus arrhizus]KAG1243121.1 hypothetical protein G6F65_022616 [Rhizopus arrhizus]KAG1578731.1 hypothetical protein G6F46_015750 [Rhizopus delemar]
MWSANWIIDTRKPRRGSWRISPAATMRSSASRSGVRPRPVFSTRSASTTALPGCNCSVAIMLSIWS